MANLRAVGCPEQTIRDIVVADLNQLFAERAQRIQPSAPIREFWQKLTTRPHPDTNQLSQFKELEEQKQSVIKQLFGNRLEWQEMLNTFWIQPDSARTSLAFLPADKQEAAYRALCDANLAYVSLEEAGQSDQTRQAAVLSDVLSSEELEEFRMRTNPHADSLRGELQYFNSTPEEFRALVKLREEMQSATNAPNDPYVRMAREAAAFGQLFGEERGREYAEKADPFYSWACRAAERCGLAEGAPDRAWQIKSQAITTMQQIRANPALPTEERRHQLEALHQTTEAQLVAVLGGKGLAIAKLGDWWLQFPTQEISP
jgi:hypothetical protein